MRVGAVEVTNAFAVPHNEKDGEVAVGQAFNKTMRAGRVKRTQTHTFLERTPETHCLVNKCTSKDAKSDA